MSSSQLSLLDNSGDRVVQLNQSEREVLFRQKSGVSGGFQNFLLSLQSRMEQDGTINLTPEDLERIPRYAFDYGGGGWEERMKLIFSRHLGPNLGRKLITAGCSATNQSDRHPGRLRKHTMPKDPNKGHGKPTAPPPNKPAPPSGELLIPDRPPTFQLNGSSMQCTLNYELSPGASYQVEGTEDGVTWVNVGAPIVVDANDSPLFWGTPLIYAENDGYRIRVV